MDNPAGAGGDRVWLTGYTFGGILHAQRLTRPLDRLAEDLNDFDKEIAATSLNDASIAQLIMITGVTLAVAAAAWRRSATSPLLQPAEAGELLRPQSARASIGGRHGYGKAAWRRLQPEFRSSPRSRPRAVFIAESKESACPSDPYATTAGANLPTSTKCPGNGLAAASVNPSNDILARAA